MNYFDIVIGLILVYSVISGFRKGLIFELASVAALVFGIWGAIRFSGYTGTRLTEYFDLSTQYLGVISFLLTFIAIVVVIHLLAAIIDKIFKAVALGLPLRILGSVFGVLKATLILSIIFVILNTIDQKKDFMPKEQMQDSVLYYPISDFAPALFPIIEGGDLLDSFRKYKKKPDPVTISTNRESPPGQPLINCSHNFLSP